MTGNTILSGLPGQCEQRVNDRRHPGEKWQSGKLTMLSPGASLHEELTKAGMG